MDISIKIEGLNQYYGRKQALKDVNLYIKKMCIRDRIRRKNGRLSDLSMHRQKLCNTCQSGTEDTTRKKENE